MEHMRQKRHVPCMLLGSSLYLTFWMGRGGIQRSTCKQRVEHVSAWGILSRVLSFLIEPFKTIALFWPILPPFESAPSKSLSWVAGALKSTFGVSMHLTLVTSSAPTMSGQNAYVHTDALGIWRHHKHHMKQIMVLLMLRSWMRYTDWTRSYGGC